MNAIEAHIEYFFTQVLQLDAKALRLEATQINEPQLTGGYI